MIQYRKIPPSKSVLLLLLFLTTNIHGFLRDNRDESRESRSNQNRFPMDFRQPTTENMPIRKINIDRIINEKDGNSDRVYDRRSFRTGTIDRTENVRSSDVNNNRQYYENVHGRDNRRSFRSGIEKSNSLNNDRRQVVRESDRFDIRRSTRSVSVRVSERRNLDQTRLFSPSRSDRIDSRTNRNQRRLPSDEQRIVKSRKNFLNRRFVENHDRNADIRISPRENIFSRRTVDDRDRKVYQVRALERTRDKRSIQNQDRRASTVPNIDERLTSDRFEHADRRNVQDQGRRRVDQRRLSTDRFERTNTREIFQRRTVDQRRSLSDERRIDARGSTVDRSERTFTRRTIGQRRLSEDQIRSSTERSPNSLNRRVTGNLGRSLDQRSTEKSTRHLNDGRISAQIRLPTSRRHDSRERSFNINLEKQNTQEIRDNRGTSRFTEQRDNQRFSEQHHTSGLRRTISLERREREVNPAKATKDNRFRHDQQVSRSDSTRYIQDNIQFKDNPLAVARSSITNKNRLIDRDNTDSTRRNSETPLNFKENIDTYSWASTAKVILAAFLIGQIFFNSSKANKFRFHNIMSLATPIKEKIQ